MKPFIDEIPEWIEQIDLTTKDNYRYRFAVENFQRIQAAKLIFPNAVAWGEWHIKDRTKQDPVRIFPCCRMNDGSGWKPTIEEAFPRIMERLPEIVDEDGRRLAYFRFENAIAVLEPYCPQSPEWIEKQAKKRTAKKQLKERQAMPLFAKQIAEEHSRENG